MVCLLYISTVCIAFKFRLSSMLNAWTGDTYFDIPHEIFSTHRVVTIKLRALDVPCALSELELADVSQHVLSLKKKLKRTWDILNDVYSFIDQLPTQHPYSLVNR